MSILDLQGMESDERATDALASVSSASVLACSGGSSLSVGACVASSGSLLLCL